MALAGLMVGYLELFEFSPDAILLTDGAGRIRHANRRAEELFGYTQAELFGQSIESLMPERFRRQHPDHVHQYNMELRPRPMGAGLELFGLRKDGREVPVDVMLQPIESPEGALVLTFVRDVSEQRSAKQKLLQAIHQLDSVLESTTMCVLAVDRAWTIEYVNGIAKHMLRVEGELHGMSMWKAFPAAPETMERLQHAMEVREPTICEDYYEPLDLWTRVKAAPWDHGGLTIFFSDISEQKRLERELETERGMRTQRVESLARLSSSLAHEIKNPLAIIHARASDLAEMAAEGESLAAHLVASSCGSILKASNRAIRILRGVAALAREGRNDPMQKVEVRAMVEQAVDLVRGRYARHSVAIETVVPDGMPMVACREVQIEQILVNLLNNAFDAVEGDPRTERWVRVEASLEPAAAEPDAVERLRIDVIDGGRGVPDAARPRLMESFFTTKPLGSGMGIGLSVSRAIAEDHHGHLELRESDGHTCFRLTLPVKAEDEEGVAA